MIKRSGLITTLFIFLLAFGKVAFSAELSDVIARMNEKLNTNTSDYYEFTRAINQVQKELYSLNPLEFKKSLEKEKAIQTLKVLFSLKSTLRFSLSDLPHSHIGKNELSDNVKGVLSGIRYIEDYLFEILIDSKPTKGAIAKILPFSSNDLFSQKSDTFNGTIESLKSGDVITLRGIVFSSAMVARVSDATQIFSHMALVYADPSGKKYLIEGMLNSGFHKKEITPELFADNARLSLYRAKDELLAKQAAEFANEQYENGIRTGNPLKYDTSLGLEENCKYYCSKFISWAYNSVLKRSLLPERPSRLHSKHATFVTSLGMPSTSAFTFAPSDIDLDTTFDLVYEFRNPYLTPGTRLDDLITDKVLYWLQRERMDIVPGVLIDTAAKGIMALASKNSVQRFINRLNLYISPELDPKHLSVIAVAALTVAKIKKAIMPEYQLYLEKNGFSMSPKEIYNLVEQKRKEDPGLIKFLKARPGNTMCFRFYASAK